MELYRLLIKVVEISLRSRTLRCYTGVIVAALSFPSLPAAAVDAFKPPVRPKLPEIKKSRWVRSPVDAFILARLEKEGLQPSPEADKTTLLRRLSLDVIGLPPTIAEVDSFLADRSNDAYQKQVERL